MLLLVFFKMYVSFTLVYFGVSFDGKKNIYNNYQHIIQWDVLFNEHLQRDFLSFFVFLYYRKIKWKNKIFKGKLSFSFSRI